MLRIMTEAKIANTKIRNRVVMAPMTRLRAELDGSATETMAEFYRQRADLGMLVTEGIYPATPDRSYNRQPGLETSKHQESWSKVTAQVHAQGGVISAQIMSGGRATHSSLSGTTPTAPSAIGIEGELYGPEGKVSFEVPRAMTSDEVKASIQRIVSASKRAIAAGFDFVEMHGGNGYLVHQFLAADTNQREDDFGGNSQRRAYFASLLLEELVTAIGADKVGIRLTPLAPVQGIAEQDTSETWQTYQEVIKTSSRLGIAYVSIAFHDLEHPELKNLINLSTSSVLLNHSDFSDLSSKETAHKILDIGADFAVVGRQALANPDLLNRWKNNLPLNNVRQEFVYSSEAEGYTDYA